MTTPFLHKIKYNNDIGRQETHIFSDSVINDIKDLDVMIRQIDDSYVKGSAKVKKVIDFDSDSGSDIVMIDSLMIVMGFIVVSLGLVMIGLFLNYII